MVGNLIKLKTQFFIKWARRFVNLFCRFYHSLSKNNFTKRQIINLSLTYSWLIFFSQQKDFHMYALVTNRHI